MNSYIHLFIFMFLQIYDVRNTFYCFTNGPTVLLLEKSCRSNRINLLTSDWFWFTAAADFPVKQSWFGSSERKSTALVALLNTRNAYKISLGGLINTHLCWICRHVFECLRLYSHMRLLNSPWNAPRGNPNVMHVSGDWRQRQYKVSDGCMQDDWGCVCDMREYSRRWGSGRNRSGCRTQRSARRTWWTLAVADSGDGHGLLLSSTILPFRLLYLCVMSSPSALRDTDLTFRIVPFAPRLFQPLASAAHLRSEGRKVFDSFAADDDSLVRLGGLSLLKRSRASSVRDSWQGYSSCHPIRVRCLHSARRIDRTFSPSEPGHDDNLEAAEELCFSGFRSPRLGLVLCIGKCWWHGPRGTWG